MHPDPAMRALLAELPARVAEGSRITRRAGTEWERLTGHTSLDDTFRQHAERYLLETLLDAAEAQIRLKAFMSAHAPTREVRELVDAALAIHRELTDGLRRALGALGPEAPGWNGAGGAPPVGIEGGDANVRGQVEDAVRSLSRTGRRPRHIVVSPNALRHLRDQGVLQDGLTSILEVPVVVDMSWPGSAFAVLTYDVVTLEEIVRSR